MHYLYVIMYVFFSRVRNDESSRSNCIKLNNNSNFSSFNEFNIFGPFTYSKKIIKKCLESTNLL